MKKLLTLLLGMLLIYSCSNTSDGTNTTTTVVPAPPENLKGEVISATGINLMWTDRSTNETGFKIERKLEGGTFEVVGTTATNIATFSNVGLTPGTTYIYRVYSYNEGGNSPTYTTELLLTTTALIPSVTTTAATSITTSSATSGGTVTSDGGAAVTARGICWSTSSNPTIDLSTQTTNVTGLGSFTSGLTGLASGTTYYVRAYATNSLGTAYGNQVSFTTLVSLVVSLTTITIGTQEWTTKNLDVATYSDGTVIPQVTDPTAWDNLTTGAWCYYNNDSATGTTYGKLYNWYAVAGIHDTDPNTPNKKLAPTGYHIPSDAEWTTLITYLGGEGVAGDKMKATGTSLWFSSNTGATNSSGFTGLPGGYRNYGGSFYGIGKFSYWWSSSEYTTPDAWFRNLQDFFGFAGRNYANKGNGFSVRCLRD